jgi:Domain of Unknown Function (DUF1080)
VPQLDRWRARAVPSSPHSAVRGFLGATLALVVIAGTFLTSPLLGGRSNGNWREVFDGYGDGLSTLETPSGQLHELVPRAAEAGDRTHAALAIDQTSLADFDLRVEMRTLKQLREGTDPNPWEVAWLVWRLDDAEHFYYLALKPNGWEVGKRDPAYPGGQRFLDTGNSPSFPVGEAWNEVRVHAVGSKFTIWIDGKKLSNFEDLERPYGSGHIGMYTEDARVQFRNFMSMV